MPLKKSYTFSKTTPAVAEIIAKVRLMQMLTVEEELVYLIQVKDLSQEAAQQIMENKSRVPKIT